MRTAAIVVVGKCMEHGADMCGLPLIVVPVAGVGDPVQFRLEPLQPRNSGAQPVTLAARDRAPQTIVHYLRELTADYHSFYNGCRIMVDDDAPLRNARAALNLAVGQVIRNGLGLLGVTAPESM